MLSILEKGLALIHDVEKELKMVLEEQNRFGRKNLAVNGQDIMEYMDIHSGREVGIWLDLLVQKVLDGSLENDRNTLLRFMTEKGELL